ncbi:TetR/AcrR family transcriptional regulator [Photobacterium sagamiensis]|uniref:TetR/AcrR family transcriptional regulator n=1 Tax=Photobacterium sagamiensis TaxID=2910241 RepID=UPI003D12F94B
MPRVSQAVAKQTRQRIIDSAFEIIIAEGGEYLTFSNLAKKAKISRSGINAHFNRKEDIYQTIKPLVIDKLRVRINYNSPREFYESWVNSFDNDVEFRRLIVGAGLFFTKKEGIGDLKASISGEASETENFIYMAIGYAVINIDED